jgi:hypothetical protein
LEIRAGLGRLITQSSHSATASVAFRNILTRLILPFRDRAAVRPPVPGKLFPRETGASKWAQLFVCGQHQLTADIIKEIYYFLA